MENKTLGGWLMGFSIAEGVCLLIAMGSDPESWYGILGMAMVAQFVFAIIGARRLMKN